MKREKACFRTIFDEWLFIENSGETYKLIAQKTPTKEIVYIENIWTELKTKYDG